MVKLQLDTGSFSFVNGPGQNSDITINADNIDIRVLLFYPYRQGAGTAGEIENSVAGTKARLFDERVLERALARRRSDDSIIIRRQPMKAERRHISGSCTTSHNHPLLFLEYEFHKKQCNESGPVCSDEP